MDTQTGAGWEPTLPTRTLPPTTSDCHELTPTTDAAIKAVQDDDGNESDADTAISDVQDDVDQNESDSDQADAADRRLTALELAVPTVPTRPTLLPTTSVLPRACVNADDILMPL